MYGQYNDVKVSTGQGTTLYCIYLHDKVLRVQDLGSKEK